MLQTWTTQAGMTLHASMVGKGESWVGWSKHVEGWATHHEHNKVTCTLPARLVVSTHTSECLTGRGEACILGGELQGFHFLYTSSTVFYQQQGLLQATQSTRGSRHCPWVPPLFAPLGSTWSPVLVGVELPEGERGQGWQGLHNCEQDISVRASLLRNSRVTSNEKRSWNYSA